MADYEPTGCEAEVVYPFVGSDVSISRTGVENILEREDGHPTLQAVLVGTEECDRVVQLHQQCGG